MTLTGTWSGAYRYPGNGSEVPFTARLDDTGAGFSGETEEDGGPAARLRGYREGRAITFIKRYTDSGDRFRDPVRYHGMLSEDGCRIDGEWVIDAASTWRGDFFMERPKPEKAEAVRRAEAVI